MYSVWGLGFVKIGGRHFGGPYNKDSRTLSNLKVLKELWAEVGSGMGLGFRVWGLG